MKLKCAGIMDTLHIPHEPPQCRVILNKGDKPVCINTLNSGKIGIPTEETPLTRLWNEVNMQSNAIG